MIALLIGAAWADGPSSGLEIAETSPEVAPPPVLLDENDLATMEAGTALCEYQPNKGRDFGFAARLVDASADSVWKSLDAIEADAAPGVKIKAAPEPGGHGDHWDIAGTMIVDQPVIRGTIKMRGHAFDDRRYIAFHLEDDAHGPFHHAYGYWSVEPYKDGKSLVLLVVDFAAAAPVPKAVRAKAVEALMPTLLDALSG